MSDYQKPMFSEDDERRPLMTEEELRDACLHNAATIVVAVELGCEFEDCRLTETATNGRRPSRASTSNTPKAGAEQRLSPPSHRSTKQAVRLSPSGMAAGLSALIISSQSEPPTFSTSPASGRRSRLSPSLLGTTTRATAATAP